ncbi:MAG: hypothetical protein U0529_03240 [Thermoanaerobaculia bacterium]
MTSSAARSAALLAAGVLLAFGLGLALRLRLGSAEFWLNPDEGIYHQVATVPSADAARASIRANVHPPLFHWMLRALAPLGEDPRSFRRPSLFAGLLAILAFGWLGSVAGAAEGGAAGRVAGAWFASTVAALSPALALQSVVARQYGLQALALALGLGALLSYLATGRRRWLVLFSASSLVAVLVLYSSDLVVAGIGIVFLGALVAGRLSRRQVAELSCAALPVLAVMAWSYVDHLGPSVLRGQIHREAMNTWLRDQFVASPAAGLVALRKAAGYAYSREMRPLVLLPALVAVGVACARRRGFAAFVALAVSVLAVALSLAGLMPLGGARYSLYLAVVQVAAGASGVAWLAVRLSGPVAAAEAPGRRRARLWLAGGLAAFVAVSVGARLVVLGRDAASGKIDSGDAERLIPRESIDGVARFLKSAPAATWVTDLQTCMLLLPLAPPKDRELRGEPAFGGTRFEALGRSFAVMPAWSLPEAAAGPDDPVERALTWIAGRDGGADGRVGVVTGGWGTSAAWRIAEDLRARGQGAAAIESVGDERLAAVVVDVASLRAWRERRTLDARGAER